MDRAIEKLAGREGTRAGQHRREVVCHRCGVQCVVSTAARLGETACVGCVQRLAGAESIDGVCVHAIRAVAEWSDRSAVGGPGYGLVSCPHCATECVVEVGGASRTACAVCLRGLGAVPLVRMDLARTPARPVVYVATDHDMRDAEPVSWPHGDDPSCVFLPGELR